MTEHPSVSVAIPCHNYGRYLDEAFDSVLRQDLGPLDVSIVDDGSTDETWARAQAIREKHQHVNVVRNVTATGAPRCFNTAVRNTHGEFVVILSADDRLSPSYLSALSDAIVANGWDFAYPDVRLFGAEDHFVPALPFEPVRLLVRNFITGSAMFRRSAFEAVGGFDERLGRRGHEDWDFWLAMVERGFRGGPVPGVALEWRRHEGGSRNTESLRKVWSVRVSMWRRHHRVAPLRRQLRYVVSGVGRRLRRP